MDLWTVSGASVLGGLWWIFPLVCIILCMVFCRSCRRSAGGKGCCFGRGGRDAEIDALKKEISTLKERMNSVQ